MRSEYQTTSGKVIGMRHGEFSEECEATATHKGLPVLRLSTRAAWERWLAEHGTTSSGVWLTFAKKGSGQTTLSKAEAIETALAYGWVDGQLDTYDAAFWLVRFTRRSARSRWSQVNRDLVTKLLAEGRVTAAGLVEVERAKRDGRWDQAYAPQRTATVPDDLQAALDAEPAAAAFFATLRGANRYAVIYRVNDAKTAKTRAERIAKFVTMLARGETLHTRAGRASSSPTSSTEG
jgi:uncharacterized protein YdeI (YjbR/CyaY-like superfamily)